MKYNPEIHHRRSIRLKGYDYSQPGAYFITICTYQKQCWFGEIRYGQMHLNQIGKIVAREWLKSPQIRPTFQLDEWIIMPNHLHGIIWILESQINPINADNIDKNMQDKNIQGASIAPLRKKLKRQANSLGSFIGGFKSSVTKQINQLRFNTSIPIWQRNYYESIIRDEKALNSIREYIQNNPQRWQEDPDNPQHHPNFSEYVLDLIF